MNMIDLIQSKINMLQSEELKKDLVLYLDFLLSKQFSENQQQTCSKIWIWEGYLQNV